MKQLTILCACEESQAVCKAFRALGHIAYSADLQDCSGGHPEWHIKGDCLPLLDGNCHFTTCDGVTHYQDKAWDILIAFPPCTYLTTVGNRWFDVGRYGEKALKRLRDRREAADFFMRFVNAKCDRIAIENPVGCMSTWYRKPNQVISPYMWATGVDDTENYVSKKTCLWLKGLPELVPNGIITKFDNAEIYGKYPSGKNRTWEDYGCGSRAGFVRSKTFSGIAKAMAEQWSEFVQIAQ